MIQKYLNDFKKRTYELKTEKISQDDKALLLVEELLNKPKKKLLIAPPSAGKTYSMLKLAEKGYKIVFLTHTQDLAKQTAIAYESYFKRKCQCLVQGNRWDSFADNNFIVSVWDSLDKISINTDDYKVVIDEAHNVIQTVSYRSRGLKLLNDIIENRDVLYITATPLGLHPLEFYDILFIEKTNDEKVFLVNKGSKSFNTIIKDIVVQAEGKTFCLLNSKNRGIIINKTLEELNGFDKSIALVSTDNEQNRRYIQENSMLQEADLTISTECLCDGVNILNEDVSDVIVVVNNINYNHIIQFIRRCRRVKAKIWIIATKQEDCKDFTWTLEEWTPLKNLFKKMSTSEKFLNEQGKIDSKQDALRKAYQRYYSKYCKIIENEQQKYEMKPSKENIMYEFYFIHHKVLYQNIKSVCEFYNYEVVECNSDELVSEGDVEDVEIERVKFSDLPTDTKFDLLYKDIVAKHNESNTNKIVQDLSLDDIDMLATYKRDISTLESKISQVMFEGSYINYMDILNNKENILNKLEEVSSMSDNEINYIKNYRKVKALKEVDSNETCVQLFDSFKTIWENRETLFTGEIKPSKKGGLFPFQILKDKKGNYNFYFLPKKSDECLTQQEYFDGVLAKYDRFTLDWSGYQNLIKTFFISEFDNSKHSTKIVGIRDL